MVICSSSTSLSEVLSSSELPLKLQVVAGELLSGELLLAASASE
jgi:hypothetical protein